MEPLLEELLRTMRGMESSFEILFVDDGSTDGSRELLDRMAKEHREVRVVHLERNAGQSAALLAGFARTASRTPAVRSRCSTGH